MEPQNSFNTERAISKIAKVLTACLVGAGAFLMASIAHAGDPTIYNVYRPIDLGDGTPSFKDFYVNIGTAEGIKVGSTLEVLRKTATYDLTSQKLYKDVYLPVAKIKVIHVESNAAIARLDRVAPSTTPSIENRAVMIGDYVRVSQ